MTVIDGIESEELKNRKKDIQLAIKNNDRIEDKLNVIMVISNPCEYKRRWYLAERFIEHMLDNNDVSLYIVELTYGNQTFHITESGNPHHLQLRTETPLWHKENMIDIGIKKLLPPDWKAVAWVDADLEFENPFWADYTLRILNGCKDVVQVFSHCLDLDANENTMRVFHGFGYQYETGKKYCASGVNFWHCGYGFAYTRKAYEKLGGIFKYAILGAGDHHMAQALIGVSSCVHPKTSDGYKKMITELVKRSRNFRIGYVPSVIKHYFHGSKKNRKYSERWEVLVNNQYDPYEHVKEDENGILIPSESCPPKLLDDIMNYFQERKEDEH